MHRPRAGRLTIGSLMALMTAAFPPEKKPSRSWRIGSGVKRSSVDAHNVARA